jgi:hypothetical protein
MDLHDLEQWWRDNYPCSSKYLEKSHSLATLSVTNVARTTVKFNSNLGDDETQQPRLYWRTVNSMPRTVGKEAIVSCCKARFMRVCSKEENLCLDYTVSRLRLESGTSWKKVSSAAARLHLFFVSYATAGHKKQNYKPWISWESQELSGNCRRWWNLQGV